MQPITPEQIEVVRDAFDTYNRLILTEQEEYFEKLVTLMEVSDYSTFTRGDDDFRDFAIVAYLHNLRKKHNELKLMVGNVIITRDIIDTNDPTI